MHHGLDPIELGNFIADIKRADKGEKLTPETIMTFRWNKIVDAARKAKARLQKSTSPVDLSLPGDTQRGTYSRLALDAYGQLSLARPPRGRRKQRLNKRMLATKSYTLLVFQRELKKYMEHFGIPADKLTPEDLGKVAARSSVIAVKEIKANRLADRQARRARQKNARRVNFGIVPGNRQLGTFAHA